MGTNVINVGEWEVYPLEGYIRGPGGEHHVRPKSMDVLVRLAASPGQVVEREQIIRDVWGRALISDEALTACIAELRRILGDRGGGRLYIQTVPKRGYRLIAEVERQVVQAQGSNPDPEPLTEPVKGLPGKPSIAVLPFENISGDPDQRYFSDGISGDIVTKLATFNELFVVAAYSSFMFGGSDLDIKEVGRRLSVQYVVEGSVRRDRENLRITARLIDSRTREQVWADRYDRQFADLFDVQDEVSASIVSTLLGKIEKARAFRAADKPTQNLSAYDCYLRGTYLQKNLTLDDLMKAKSYFEKAIELDKNFAAAHSRLASIYLALVFILEIHTDESEIRSTVEHAIRLDPDDSWGRLMLGFSLTFRQQYDLAGSHFEAALQGRPNDAELTAWVGLAFVVLGELEKARRLISTAKQRNPLQHGFYHSILGRLAYLEGDYAASIEAFRLSTGYEERMWDVATTAASMAQLGLMEDAAQEASRVTDLIRHRSTDNDQPADFEQLLKLRLVRFKRESDRQHLIDGYRKAGLIE